MNERSPRALRVSPAAVISLLALFIAIGGTASALKGKNTVDSGDIKNGQVKSPDLGKRSVQSKHIAPGAIGAGHIADGAIGEENIADGAVTSEKIQDGSVTEAKIGDGAITPGKIAAQTPAASVTRQSDQEIAYGVPVDISFNSERYDTANSFDPGTPTCLTAPIDGIYDVVGGVVWEADKDGQRWLTLRKSNGTVLAQSVTRPLNDSEQAAQTVSASVPLTAGECVKLTVQQTATDFIGPPVNAELPRTLDVKSLTGANGASPSLSMVWAVPGE